MQRFHTLGLLLLVVVMVEVVVEVEGVWETSTHGQPCLMPCDFYGRDVPWCRISEAPFSDSCAPIWNRCCPGHVCASGFRVVVGPICTCSEPQPCIGDDECRWPYMYSGSNCSSYACSGGPCQTTTCDPKSLQCRCPLTRSGLSCAIPVHCGSPPRVFGAEVLVTDVDGTPLSLESAMPGALASHFCIDPLEVAVPSVTFECDPTGNWTALNPLFGIDHVVCMLRDIAPPSSSPGLTTGLVVGVVGGFFVNILALILCYYRFKRKPRPADDDDPPQTDPPPVPGPRSMPSIQQQGRELYVVEFQNVPVGIQIVSNKDKF